jgi:serine/threonine protein kinase
MAAAHWTRVNNLFHHALELPPAERARVVGEAAAGDRALYDEVMSLLAAHERAAMFIEEPAATSAGLLESAAGEPAALVGRALGQYQIVRVLGEGGMGIVYLAEDTRLGRAVAVKALAPRLTRDPSGRARLAREARAAAALAHPGIATVYALEEIDSDLFIVSEYVPGSTLREELANGPLAAGVVLETSLAIARALEAAHARGIVHRDLKPENVIRMPSGQIKVLDFGLARFADPTLAGGRLTMDGSVFGTPAYMSPEQIRSEVIDGRSDLFSLGVVMFELLTGENPFLGADGAGSLANVLEKEPPPVPIESLAGDRSLAARLEVIARACLRKAAEARMPSARELASALERARDQSVSPSTEHGAVGAYQSLSTPTPRPHAFWWWQFHQAAASASYLALLVPLWLVHRAQPGPVAMLLFLAGLAAALTATTLRLHLWFSARAYPAEWATQHRLTRRWMALADSLFVGALIAGAGLTITVAGTNDVSGLAVLFVAAAVAVVVSFTVIEPATRRAALG